MCIPKKVRPDGEEKKGKFSGRLPKLQQVDRSYAFQKKSGRMEKKKKRKFSGRLPKLQQVDRSYAFQKKSGRMEKKKKRKFSGRLPKLQQVDRSYARQKKSGRMEKKKKENSLDVFRSFSKWIDHMHAKKSQAEWSRKKKKKILWSFSEASASGSYKCHNVERDHNVALPQ